MTDGFDEEQLEVYRSEIQSVDGVQEVKDQRARNYGNNAVVDVVIPVQLRLDLHTAHDISTLMENCLQNEYDVYTVHIHVEPGSASAAVMEGGKI